jgi:hypothetical protein
VRVKAPGVSVKARRGYFAPSDKPVTSRSTAATATTAAASGPSPVDVALSLLARVRPSAEILTYGIARTGELAIVAEIPRGDIANGKWSSGGDVRAVVTGSQGDNVSTATARLEPGARSVLLRVPLAAGANGPWRATVTLVGAADRAEDALTVEADASKTLVGNPVVYRAAPGPRSPLQPVADFQFLRTERVHVEWPILQPLDQRSSRLLSRTGQPMPVQVAATERDVDGRTMFAVDLNLAPLGPGEYVIEITVGSGATSEQKLMAIRVGS